jgi:hypothetical protein
MTLIETIESLAKMPSGAIFTDENRYDQLYLISIANKFRAAVVRKDYQINKRINPITYQRYYPRFVQMEQYEWCFYRFKCPAPINLDDMSNGFRFVGTINSSKNFDIIKNRGELSTFLNHPILSPTSGRNICALYDGTTGYWEIYAKDNKLPKRFVVEMLQQNPLDNPEFNLDFDQYPISQDLYMEMEQLVFQANTSITAGGVPDLIADSADVQANPRSKRQ